MGCRTAPMLGRASPPQTIKHRCRPKPNILGKKIFRYFRQSHFVNCAGFESGFRLTTAPAQLWLLVGVVVAPLHGDVVVTAVGNAVFRNGILDATETNLVHRLASPNRNRAVFPSRILLILGRN